MSRNIRNMELPDARQICLVGGGGKTTCMLWLARRYAEAGRRVVVSTTTHLMMPGSEAALREHVYPSDLCWIREEDRAAVKAGLEQNRIVLVGAQTSEKERIGGPSPAFLRELREMADVVILEADGSRRCPVKIPREKEPVIPEGTDLVIAILGLSALGRPLKDCAFHPELLAPWLEKSESDPLTAEDAVKILSSREGGRKHAEADYCVVLNQADSFLQQQEAERILEALAAQGIRGFWKNRRENAAVILLAAGQGSRFCGEKLLAELEPGRPMYLPMVEKAEKLPVERRILVCRHREIMEAVAARESGWILVENRSPELGISRSMKLGIGAAPDADGWMFCVCDQPGIPVERMEEMLACWRRGEAGVLSMSCRGRCGNPRMFSSYMKEDLMNLEGDVGGRGILARWPQEHRCIEAAEERELLDLDDRETYDRYLLRE